MDRLSLGMVLPIKRILLSINMLLVEIQVLVDTV